jgi:hypothetical protein
MSDRRGLTYVKCHTPIFVPGNGGKSINFTDTITPVSVQPDRNVELWYQDNGVLMVTKSGIEVLIPMSNVSNLVFAKAK